MVMVNVMVNVMLLVRTGVRKRGGEMTIPKERVGTVRQDAAMQH